VVPEVHRQLITALMALSGVQGAIAQRSELQHAAGMLVQAAVNHPALAMGALRLLTVA
jgi:hypothetical protein